MTVSMYATANLAIVIYIALHNRFFKTIQSIVVAQVGSCEKLVYFPINVPLFVTNCTTSLQKIQMNAVKTKQSDMKWVLHAICTLSDYVKQHTTITSSFNWRRHRSQPNKGPAIGIFFSEQVSIRSSGALQ